MSCELCEVSDPTSVTRGDGKKICDGCEVFRLRTRLTEAEKERDEFRDLALGRKWELEELPIMALAQEVRWPYEKYMRLRVLWSGAKKRLADVEKRAELAKAVLKTRWEHRCKDGVGGCTAVSAAALENYEEEAQKE